MYTCIYSIEYHQICWQELNNGNTKYCTIIAYKPQTKAKWKYSNMQCKDTVPKIRNKYSQQWNCATSFPTVFLHSCICERFIYSHSLSVHLVCSKIGGPIVERGRAVSFLGIHKSDLLCSVKTTYWSRTSRSRPCPAGPSYRRTPTSPSRAEPPSACSTRKIIMWSKTWLGVTFRLIIINIFDPLFARWQWDEPNHYALPHVNSNRLFNLMYGTKTKDVLYTKNCMSSKPNKPHRCPRPCSSQRWNLWAPPPPTPPG